MTGVPSTDPRHRSALYRVGHGQRMVAARECLGDDETVSSTDDVSRTCQARDEASFPTRFSGTRVPTRWERATRFSGLPTSNEDRVGVKGCDGDPSYRDGLEKPGDPDRCRCWDLMGFHHPELFGTANGTTNWPGRFTRGQWGRQQIPVAWSGSGTGVTDDGIHRHPLPCLSMFDHVTVIFLGLLGKTEDGRTKRMVFSQERLSCCHIKKKYITYIYICL